AYRFMTDKNAIFTGVTATFDETIYPRCSSKPSRGITPIRGYRKSPSDDGPSDEENDQSTLEDDDEFPKQPHRQPPTSSKDRVVPEGRIDPDVPAPEEQPPPPEREPLRERQRPPPPPRREPLTRVPQIPRRPGNLYDESQHPSDVEHDTCHE